MLNKVERLPRRHLIYLVRIESPEGDHFTGRLVDISEKGMKIVSKEKVFIDSTYLFEIILPGTIDDCKEIKCTGKTIWYKHHQNPEKFSAGFEIEGVDRVNKALLKKMVKEFVA